MHPVKIIFALLLPGLVKCGSNPDAVPLTDCTKATPKASSSDILHFHVYFDTTNRNAAFNYLNAIVCLNMPDFGNRIKLDFMPGAGSEILNGKLDCENGLCDNAIELQCVKGRIKSYRDYICCRTKERTKEECCKEQGTDWSTIEPCTTTKEPIEEIKKNVVLRKRFNISQSNLPVIVVNNEYDACTSYFLFEDYIKTTCTLMNPKPKVCN